MTSRLSGRELGSERDSNRIGRIKGAESLLLINPAYPVNFFAIKLNYHVGDGLLVARPSSANSVPIALQGLSLVDIHDSLNYSKQVLLVAPNR
jgi:hypothetical protein